jgi:hypothetical protein
MARRGAGAGAVRSGRFVHPDEFRLLFTAAYYAVLNKKPEVRGALVELMREAQPLLLEQQPLPYDDPDDAQGSAARAAVEAFAERWHLPRTELSLSDVWSGLRTAVRRGGPPAIMAVRAIWLGSVGTEVVSETEPGPGTEPASGDPGGTILWRERVPAIWPPQLPPLPYDPREHSRAQREAFRKRWHQAVDEAFDEQARELERQTVQAGYRPLPGEYYKDMVDGGSRERGLERYADRLYRRAVLEHPWQRIAADDRVSVGTVRRQVGYWAEVLDVALPVRAAGRPRRP